MLTLPIKRKWFEMIENGIKKEEYREIKPYYASRFKNIGQPFVMRFRAGYAKDSPLMECRVVAGIGAGREEWGAVPGERYFVLSVIEVKRITAGGA